MGEIIIAILGVILCLAGIVGCVIPALPGPPLNLAALFLLAIARGFQPPLSGWLLLAMTVLTAVVLVADYLIPIAGAKKYGGSKWGVWGSIIGMILGIATMTPLGMLAGTAAGAVLGEMLGGKRGRDALRAGGGVLIGTFWGIIIKLVASGVITVYFIRGLIA